MTILLLNLFGLVPNRRCKIIARFFAILKSTTKLPNFQVFGYTIICYVAICITGHVVHATRVHVVLSNANVYLDGKHI